MVAHSLSTGVMPRVVDAQAALGAEQRLFAHYHLSACSHEIQLQQHGTRVRVLEVGHGEPVIVLPGGSGEAYPYAALVSHLPGKRFLIINRPGAGLSEFIDHRKTDLRTLAIDVLTSVMDAYGLERAPMIANSMAGLWALWFAQAHPERVVSMVQIGCPALVLGTSAPFMMRLMSVPGIGHALTRFLVAKDVHSASDGLAFMGTTTEVIQAQPQVVNEAVYAFSNLPDFRPAWSTLLQSAVTPFGARRRYAMPAAALREITTPTLVLWGDNDPFGGMAVARGLASTLAHAQLRVIHAGHLPHVDQPQVCAAPMLAFWAGD